MSEAARKLIAGEISLEEYLREFQTLPDIFREWHGAFQGLWDADDAAIDRWIDLCRRSEIRIGLALCGDEHELRDLISRRLNYKEKGGADGQ